MLLKYKSQNNFCFINDLSLSIVIYKITKATP